MTISELPTVTLVVPVRNEERHIDACLASLVAQSYPDDRLRIIVVDGDSTDATPARVAAWAAKDARITVLSNPARFMPQGLNIGIWAAASDLVGVIIGHSAVRRDYVQRTVEALARTKAAAVGGRYVRIGVTAWQRAIATATASPVGVGDSRHNYARTGHWAETVFPGMWRRSLFDEIGLFDPAMVVNEDNELSYRIRRAGGRLWYEPSIEIDYVPRGSLRDMFHQYRRYGFGKVRVFRKHPGSVRWRQLVPPAWIAFLLLGAVVAWLAPPSRAAWLTVVALYLIVIVVESLRISRPTSAAWRVAATLVTLHLAYAIGVWQGVFEVSRR